MEKQINVTAKKLDRFTACFAFVFNAEYNSLRGITDEENKMLCIYAASRIFDVGDGILSTYYRINVDFMRSKLQDIKVKVLVNTDLADRVGNVRLYWELECDRL